MAITVNGNSVKDINAALLSMRKEIDKVSSISTKDINTVKEQKLVQYTFKSPLKQTNNTVTVDTTGVWLGTARSAVNAEKASSDSNGNNIAAYYVPASRKINNKELTADITLSASDVSAIPSSSKGAANGIASLDENGKVPVTQLPSSIMQYKGTWDASTNTPTLSDGMSSAIVGDVYVCNKAGTIDLGSGEITFYEGDWVMYNGSIWERSANANLVKSVNGKQGVVELTASEIPMPTGYIYYQIYNPTDAAWEASPETMFPLNAWEDITSDFASYPFFKATSTTTGSGHNAYHTHSIKHTHTMAHTHSIDHTHSNGTTANSTIFASGSGNSYNGVGGKTFGTDSRTVTIPKYTGSSGAASNSTTSQPSSTSSGSSGSGDYPEPNYSGMKIWRCTGLKA